MIDSLSDGMTFLAESPRYLNLKQNTKAAFTFQVFTGSKLSNINGQFATIYFLFTGYTLFTSFKEKCFVNIFNKNIHMLLFNKISSAKHGFTG